MQAVDVRVTPASKGRDMSDFFVGCRDVLLSGDYDLIVKVHSRRKQHKTMNVRRYFRRYQYENLLNSPRVRREPARALPAGTGPRASSSRR